MNKLRREDTVEFHRIALSIEGDPVYAEIQIDWPQIGDLIRRAYNANLTKRAQAGPVTVRILKP